MIYIYLLPVALPRLPEAAKDLFHTPSHIASSSLWALIVQSGVDEHGGSRGNVKEAEAQHNKCIRLLFVDALGEWKDVRQMPKYQPASQ